MVTVRQADINRRRLVRRTVAEYPAPNPQATPCRLWQGATDEYGYGIRYGFGDGKRRRVHRWIMTIALGRDLQPTEVVRHLCDQPLCYRFEHLALGSQADNVRDTVSRGRNGCPPRKLSDADVVDIRASNDRNKHLAQRYNVDPSTISHIRRGRDRRQK